MSRTRTEKVVRPALQLPKYPAMVDAAAITINLMRPLY